MTPLTPTCPACERPGGALTANPHCASQNCDWNKCNFGTTYSRKTAAGYAYTPKPVHYPRKETK